MLIIISTAARKARRVEEIQASGNSEMVSDDDTK
jgi:hypothetical protein